MRVQGHGTTRDSFHDRLHKETDKKRKHEKNAQKLYHSQIQPHAHEKCRDATTHTHSHAYGKTDNTITYMQRTLPIWNKKQGNYTFPCWRKNVHTKTLTPTQPCKHLKKTKTLIHTSSCIWKIHTHTKKTYRKHPHAQYRDSTDKFV